jgi:uncharacterized membrane protein YfcA
LSWPLTAAQTLWCAAALFAGYAVRGVAGFGSGIVATPLLAFVLPLSTIAPLITFLGAFVSVRQALRDRTLIEWRLIGDFVPGIVVGVPVGLWLFRVADAELLIKALGVYVIAYAVYSLVAAHRHVSLTLPRGSALVLGTFGAIVATLFGGLAGPIYVTYLDAARLPMRVFRVTVSTTLLVLSLARSIGYLASGVFAIEDFTLVAAAALPVYLGVLAGDRLHDRLDATTFRRVVGALLVVSGMALLLR